MDCFECGSCSFVCPSNIPLVQYFRMAKTSDQKGEAGRGFMNQLAKTLEIGTSPHINRRVHGRDDHAQRGLGAAAGHRLCGLCLRSRGPVDAWSRPGSCCRHRTPAVPRVRQAIHVGDWSVAITGLLYGLTLPPLLPLWMTAIGGVVAVGPRQVHVRRPRGYNPFNPALVGTRGPAGRVPGGDDHVARRFAVRIASARCRRRSWRFRSPKPYVRRGLGRHAAVRDGSSTTS